MHGIPTGFKSKGLVLWTSQSLGFAELPTLGNSTGDCYRVYATVGFSQICVMVSWHCEQSQKPSNSGGSVKMWKFLKVYSQADPSWPQPFIAGTCLRAKVTRKPIWDFVFRHRSGAPTLLGCFKWKSGPFLVFLQI